MELVDVQVVADGLAFPEGPVAMADGSVIVVEIHAGLITRCLPGGAKEVVAEVGGGPNGAAIGPDGALYVCNNGGPRSRRPHPPAIQRVDLATGEWEALYVEAEGTPLVAPNDIVFDTEGGFWFTDMKGGAILYAQPDGSASRRVVGDASFPNGIGLSPDGSVLYWAQTFSRQLVRRRISSPGEVVASPGMSITSLVRNGALDPWSLVVGLPGCIELDSLAIDSLGRVCIGGLVDSGIVVVDPATHAWELRRLPEHLADGAVTNICFGGPDNTTAFITTSEHGRLLSAQWDAPGAALAFGA